MLEWRVLSVCVCVCVSVACIAGTGRTHKYIYIYTYMRICICIYIYMYMGGGRTHLLAGRDPPLGWERPTSWHPDPPPPIVPVYLFQVNFWVHPGIGPEGIRPDKAAPFLASKA